LSSEYSRFLPHTFPKSGCVSKTNNGRGKNDFGALTTAKGKKWLGVKFDPHKQMGGCCL